MKKNNEQIPDWVFALFVAFVITFLMGGMILAGVKIIAMVGMGR